MRAAGSRRIEYPNAGRKSGFASVKRDQAGCTGAPGDVEPAGATGATTTGRLQRRRSRDGLAAGATDRARPGC
jgi:hypothetical protein